MKLLLVVNPTAAAFTPERRDKLEDALGAAHDLAVAETAERDDAIRLARQAADEGRDAVVVLGGDGTLNEAANGLAGTATALAPLPGGSTNVFARTIGVAKDVEGATTQLLDALSRNSRRRVEMGTADGRHFLFHVGMGYDAAVVERVEQRSQLKRRLGQLIFVYAGMTTWARHFDRTKPPLRVHLADGEGVGDGYLAICLKTDPYTYLGNWPLTVAPGTGLGTGLALVLFLDLGLATLGRAIGAALRHPEHLGELPGVEVVDNVESLSVEGHRPFPYQVDGDFLGWVDRLELGCRPDCLDLIVPDRSPHTA